jgi:hypothetical protein
MSRVARRMRAGPAAPPGIAAEGTVQWDTDKRLFNILDRNPGRRLPVVIRVGGASNLSVATSLGRILRDRGIDTTVGTTEVEVCKGKSDAECFALKRTGGPLQAKMKALEAPCDLTCVLMLAGGVHRSLPAGTRMVLAGMVLRNRMAPNVSQEARDALPARYGEQFRRYLREMGVGTDLLDIVEAQDDPRRAIEVPPAEWARLHIVN